MEASELLARLGSFTCTRSLASSSGLQRADLIKDRERHSSLVAIDAARKGQVNFIEARIKNGHSAELNGEERRLAATTKKQRYAERKGKDTHRER